MNYSENTETQIFRLPYKKDTLYCIVTEKPYKHVSVSVAGKKSRTPTWEEMCFVKDRFFEPEEEAFQIHPKKSEYVNVQKYTLHLWAKEAFYSAYTVAEVEL